MVARFQTLLSIVSLTWIDYTDTQLRVKGHEIGAADISNCVVLTTLNQQKGGGLQRMELLQDHLLVDVFQADLAARSVGYAGTCSLAHCHWCHELSICNGTLISSVEVVNQFLEFRILTQFLSGQMFQAIDSRTWKLQAGRDGIEEVTVRVISQLVETELDRIGADFQRLGIVRLQASRHALTRKTRHGFSK